MKYAPPFALWHRISRNTLPPRLGNLPLGGYGRGWPHVLGSNRATAGGKDTSSQPHRKGRMGSAIHYGFFVPGAVDWAGGRVPDWAGDEAAPGVALEFMATSFT